MAASPYFWQRVQAVSPAESILEFESAVDARYHDAQMLLADPDRWCGACYLLGYCVELCLKVAYLRLVGLGPNDPVWTTYITITGSPARTLRHHKINDLSILLSSERQARGLDKDPVFEAEIRTWAAIVGLHWNESLRYRGAHPTRAETAELDLAATWMMVHREELEK